MGEEIILGAPPLPALSASGISLREISGIRSRGFRPREHLLKASAARPHDSPTVGPDSSGDCSSPGSALADSGCANIS